MSLRFGKNELGRVAEILEQEHETVADAAKACLLEMEAIFAARAKFVVVGQRKGSKEMTEIPPSHPEALKMSLGFYSTEGDARSAAQSLWWSTASGDTFRTWVLPMFHGTAADFHGKRKEQLVAVEQKRKDADLERIKASIAKRDQEALARAEKHAEFLADPSWPCPGARIRANDCPHTPACKK